MQAFNSVAVHKADYCGDRNGSIPDLATAIVSTIMWLSWHTVKEIIRFWLHPYKEALNIILHITIFAYNVFNQFIRIIFLYLWSSMPQAQNILVYEYSENEYKIINPLKFYIN